MPVRPIVKIAVDCCVSFLSFCAKPTSRQTDTPMPSSVAPCPIKTESRKVTKTTKVVNQRKIGWDKVTKKTLAKCDGPEMGSMVGSIFSGAQL